MQDKGEERGTMEKKRKVMYGEKAFLNRYARASGKGAERTTRKRLLFFFGAENSRQSLSWSPKKKKRG